MGWGTLPEVRDRSAGPPGGPEALASRVLGRVLRPYLRSGACWEALPEVWDGSGDPPIGLGLAGKPSRKSRTGREDLREVRDGSGAFLEFWYGSGALPSVCNWSVRHL